MIIAWILAILTIIILLWIGEGSIILGIGKIIYGGLVLFVILIIFAFFTAIFI